MRYTDNDNNETIVGCVWMKLKAEDPVITQLKTFGVSLDVGRSNNGLTVGYRNTIKVAPSKKDAFYNIYFDSSEPFASKVDELLVNDLQ